MIEVIENNGIIVVSANKQEILLTREQAEELYTKLDAELWDETREKIERQLSDLQYREDLLKESLYFAEKRDMFSGQVWD